MIVLLLGLALFIAPHSVRLVADDWRAKQLARWGERRWKGAYSLLSATGFVLIVWGYSLARRDPVPLWQPVPGAAHVAGLLTLIAFVLIAAAYVPPNRIKARLGHPMLAGTKVWAFAHLLANGTLADLLLFGTFLAWAVVGFVSARRRDRASGVVYPAGTARGDALAVAIGVVAWAVFAGWLHGEWIGVRPFG
jgi:uncharacterized membrane protein